MQIAQREGTNGGVGALSRQLNRLIGDFFDTGLDLDVATLPGASAFAVDIAETPESFVVKAEIPGIDPKAVEISIAENVLTIKGERHEEKEEKGKTWHRVERSHGSFARSVRLPVAVLADKVEAEAKDGVITVTVPKARQAIAKRVEVKAK